MSDDYATLIPGFPVFQGYTIHGARSVLESGEVRQHQPGEMLCREGDTAESVFLVLTGKVEVFVEREGKPVVFREAGPGTILGELAVLCGIPRAACLRAVDQVVALHWPKENFRRMLLGNAFLSERIMRNALLTLIDKERSLFESLARQQGAGTP